MEEEPPLWTRRINVPESLCQVLKVYAKEVIRQQPRNILEFSLCYFKQLEENAEEIGENEEIGLSRTSSRENTNPQTAHCDGAAATSDADSSDRACLTAADAVSSVCTEQDGHSYHGTQGVLVSTELEAEASKTGDALVIERLGLQTHHGIQGVLSTEAEAFRTSDALVIARLQTELKATILERNMAREEASILKKKLSTYKNYDGNHAQVDQAATSETEIKGPGKEAGDGSHVHNSEVEDARFASPQHLRSNRLAMSSQIDTESGKDLTVLVQKSILCCLKRLNEDAVEEGEKGFITSSQLREVLKEFIIDPLSADGIDMRETFGLDDDEEGEIDFFRFRDGLNSPSPLEGFTSSMPIGSVLASALTPIILSQTAGAGVQHLSGPLLGLLACSKAELSLACHCLTDGIFVLLERAIQNLRETSSKKLAQARTLGERSSSLGFDAGADDEEVITNLFQKMCQNGTEISADAIKVALEKKKSKQEKEMVELLEKMLLEAPITLNKLKDLAKSTPRLSGQRVVWAASLSLDSELAKFLRSGSLFDGLQGIKKMKVNDLRSACNRFSIELPRLVEREWRKLQNLNSPDAQGKSGFQGVMNKFVDEGGFLGKFGDQKMFHAGLESQIGYPNPKLFKAILREHCFSVDSDDIIITGNYGLAFAPAQEFARMFGKEKHHYNEPEKLPVVEYLRVLARQSDGVKGQNGGRGPTLKELEEVNDELTRLQKVYLSVMKRKNAVFPGEDGDEHTENIFEISVKANNIQQANSIHSALPDFIVKMNEKYADFIGLKSDSKTFKLKKSGVDIRDLEAIARGVKLVGTSPVDGANISVRISIPVSLKERKEEFELDKFLKAIILSETGQSAEVRFNSNDRITFYFVDKLSHYGESMDEQDLRKELKALSSHELQARGKIKLDISEVSKIIKETDYENVLMNKIVDTQKQMIRCKQARRRLSLMELMEIREVKEAQLRVEEAMVVYQYTGPLFQKWNGLLRQIPNITGNHYTTTIHVLVSAVLKISQTTKVPEGRRVFRGLGGMVLDEKWFNSDVRRTRGGVELGFLSTTLNRSTALEYSGVKKGRGIVLDIDVGAIDCGAQLDCLSQYPGEGELLFSPLSYLEVVGMPRFQIFDGKQVVVINVKINVNLKAQKIEDMIQKRQQMHLASFDFLVDSVKYDILKVADENIPCFLDRLKEDRFRKNHTLEEIVEEIVGQVEERREIHKKISSTEYLDNDIFRGLVIDMLDTAAMARSKMQVYLDDKSLYIRDVKTLSLSAAHRMRIAFYFKNLPEDADQKKEKAEALCRLKGLQNALNKNQSALIRATANGLSFEDLKLLLDTGIDVNQTDEDGTSAVYVAAQCGNVRCIESLVSLGADINSKDKEERTALFAAAKIGDLSCVKRLIDLHADVNAIDKHGSTALMVAAAAGYFDCVKELAKLGKDVDSADLKQLKPEMFSALTVAIEKGQLEVVKYIMKFIADKDHLVLLEDFQGFCVPLIKKVDLKSLSLLLLSTVGIDSKENENFDKFVGRFHDNFVQTIMQICPYLGQTLFRLCDVNRNGKVSESEVVECLRIFMAVGAANDFVAEFSEFSKAVFRIFDINGNGCIELAESTHFLKEILVQIHSLLKGVLGHFQQEFFDTREPLQEVVNQFIEILSDASSLSIPFPVKDVVAYLNSFYTNEDLRSLLDSLSESAMIPEELQPILNPGYESLVSIGNIALEQLQAFMVHIKRTAVDDTISTFECVRMGLVCINNIFDDFETERSTLEACMVDMVMFIMGEICKDIDEENPLKFILVDKNLVQNIINAVIFSVSSNLKETGLRRYLEALFAVFSGSRLSEIKVPELIAVKNLVRAAFASKETPDFKAKFEEAQQAILKLITSLDSNKNSSLEVAEITVFVETTIKFIFSWLDVTADMLKDAICSSVSPVSALVLNIKSQIIGGSDVQLIYTEISAVALAIGMAMGEFRALNFAMDLIGNNEGNIDQKSLEDLCQPVFKLILGSPPMRKLSNDFFSNFGESFMSPEFLLKIHNSLMSKIDIMCPIVGKTLFRLLDLDRSGTVTKQEVTEFLEILKELESDSSPEKQFVTVAHALFRILDLNGDGDIQASELSETFSEIMLAGFEMAVGLMRELQNILTNEPLEQIVDQFIEMMQNEGEWSESGMPIKQIIRVLNSGFSGEDLVGLFGIITQAIESPEDQFGEIGEQLELNTIWSEFKNILVVISHQYGIFFSKARESSTDKVSSKNKLVQLASECVFQIFDSVQHAGVKLEEIILDLIMSGIFSILSEFPDENAMKFVFIDRASIQTIISTAMHSLHMSLKETGAKGYFEALFNLFDLKDTGNIRMTDLDALRNMVDAAFIDKDASNAKEKVAQIQESLLKLIVMLDTDGDAILGKSEIIACSKAIAELVFTWIKVSVHMVERTIVASIIPASNMLLKIKNQILGGQASSLTHADVCSAILAVSMMDNSSPEIIGYLKNLLVYKEGDVDAMVFENLCSNMVQMFFFWAPAARETSKEWLSAFGQFVGWQPGEASVVSFHNNVMREVTAICPFLGSALYRFFDLDKSGSVSAKEVVESLELIQALASGDAIDHILIAKGIFRIFDLDGDEKIGQQEMEKIVAELLDLTYTVSSQVLNHLGASVAEEPLKEAVRLFLEQIENSDGSENGNFAIGDIVQALSQLWSSNDLADGVSVLLEAMIELTSLAELESVVLVIQQQYAEFWDKFSAAKSTGCHLDIAYFKIIGKGCIIEVLESLFKTSDVLENRIMELIFEIINELDYEQNGEKVFTEKNIIPGENGFILVKMEILTAQKESKRLTRIIHVPLYFIYNLIRTAVKTLHNSLLESGTNVILSAGAQLLDPACTGKVLISDIFHLRDSLIALIDARGDADEFNSRLEQTLSAWLGLSAKQSEDDKLLLSHGEALMYSRALVQIFINLIQEIIKEFFSTATALSPPTIELGFNIKGRVLETDEKILTFEDISNIKHIFEWE